MINLICLFLDFFGFCWFRRRWFIEAVGVLDFELISVDNDELALVILIVSSEKAKEVATVRGDDL